jgi:hypothetical protein
MNLQAQNDFIYLDDTYPQPYFIITYYPDIDAHTIPVNCFMFASKESHDTGGSYVQSFGSAVAFEIATDDVLVTNEVIGLLQEISPTTLFTQTQ